MATYQPPMNDEPGGWEFTDAERETAMTAAFVKLGNDDNAQLLDELIGESFPACYEQEATEAAYDHSDWIHEKLMEWRKCAKCERPLIGNMVSKVLKITELEAIEFLDELETMAEQYIEGGAMLQNELENML